MAQIKEMATEVTFMAPDGPKPQLAYLDIPLKGEALGEWKPVTLPTGEAVTNLVHNDETGRLYAATDKGTIFCSDDKGESWFEARCGSIEELRA